MGHSFIEDQDMTVFVEIIRISGHKGEELGLSDVFLGHLDADLLGEHLIEQWCQLVLLLVQRKEHLWVKIIQVPQHVLHLDH